MTDKKVAVEISFEELSNILGLPSDTEIICVSMQKEQIARVAMKTEHGFIIPNGGIIPVAPLAQLQIKRLEEEL